MIGFFLLCRQNILDSGQINVILCLLKYDCSTLKDTSNPPTCIQLNAMKDSGNADWPPTQLSDTQVDQGNSYTRL